MTGKCIRTTLRWAHIVGAICIGILLYSPLIDNIVFLNIVRFGVFPLLLSITGIAMWQQRYVNKLVRQNR